MCDPFQTRRSAPPAAGAPRPPPSAWPQAARRAGHRAARATRALSGALALAGLCGAAAGAGSASASASASPATPAPTEAASPARGEVIDVRLLGFNDFHGQISRGRQVAGRPVGGAGVFKAWIDAASRGHEGRVLIAGAGDMVGASPIASALLRDEPTLAFLDSLGNRHCSRAQRHAPRCNLVGTPGNHEFDKGRHELLRQLHGGPHAEGPFLVDPWPGLAHGWVGANVVDRASGRPLLPPFTVKQVSQRTPRGLRTARVGFIGATLRGTASIVAAEGVRGLAFGDEAEAINTQVRRLRRQGVEAIVVLLHQGGSQPRYEGPTDASRPGVEGPIVDIVARLDEAVDVVISGHTHQFTNALLPNAAGRPVLVVQSHANGSAFSQVDLQLDARSGDVVGRSARIVTTWGDEGPGLAPDAAALALVHRAETRVAPIAGRPVAQLRGAFTRAQTPAGESTLGNLVADAHAAAMGTRYAFTNPGGLRTDLGCAPVADGAPSADCEATYGQLFAAQPFGNTLVRLELSGAQITALLEQQWQGERSRFLQPSGLAYTWDAAKVEGGICRACVAEVRDVRSGRPLEPQARYAVTVNSYLASGGDDFTLLREGTAREVGPLDVDGLIAWLRAQPQPVEAVPAGARIRRLN